MRETTTTTTTIMTTMIASSTTIESMGAAVLVPHLARWGFDVVVVITTLSCAVRKCAEARTFKHHQHTNVLAFVRGQGRRDDCVDGVDADNIIC